MTDSDKQNTEAVEALAPITRKVTAGGKEYEVRRLETRQIWPVLRCGLPITEGLTALVQTASSPAADSPLGSSKPAGQTPGVKAKAEPKSQIAALLGDEIASFLELMAEHGERITEIVAISLDETVAKVGKFEIQETYLAIRAIIEVNRDFFTHRVAPLLGLQEGGMERNALAGAVSQATEAMRNIGDGATPSSN